MARKVLTYNNFTGGIAQGSLKGYKGSFQDGIGLDYRSDPDKLTALKKLKKDSGSNVTDLVKWIKEYVGDYYMYGDTGKIYKRTSAGTYTNPKTVSSSHGNGIEVFNNELWYMGDASVGRTTGLSTTPTFGDDYFVSRNKETDIESNVSPTPALNYAIPTAISEAAADRKSFTPTVSTVAGFVLLINDKAARDLTITLHDNSNNYITSILLTSAVLPTGAAYMRVFLDGAYPVTIGNSYHIHITASNTGATMRAGTLNDLTTTTLETLVGYNDKDVDIRQASGTIVDFPLVYNVPLTLTEGNLNRKYVVPTKSTIKGVSVLINTKGSGDWTLTMHDQNHNVIGTSTVTNANLTGVDAYTRFNFTNYLTVVPGLTYHFHLNTSSTATTTRALVSTTNDLNTIYFMLHFQVLNTDTLWHPAKVFTNLLSIGNGNALLTIDDSEVIDPEAIVFPLGEKVRCLETIGDYLAIATWRGTSLSDYGSSRIYFWDGVSPTFNAFIDIDGQTNSILNSGNNILYIWHGTTGQMSTYTGGITKLRTVNGVGENKTMEVFPGAATKYEGLVYFGVSDGTSTTVDRVMYSYGRKDKDYPYSLNKDFTISTGNKGNTVQIGAVLGVSATNYFVSWKDSSTYGVDIIDTANDQASVFMQTLRIDGDIPNREKGAKSLSLRYAPITSTQTITVAYRRNNTGNFTTLGTVDGTVSTDLASVEKSFTSADFRSYWFELEVKITLATSGTDAPVLLAMELDVEGYSQSQLGIKS